MRVRPRHVLWTLAALAVVIAALAAAAAWRLSHGPVNLALLAPHVETALSRPQNGYRVEFESVEASWAGWQRLLRFNVSEARVVNLEGTPLVEAQGLEFALDAGQLLSGRVVPRDIELLGVRATVRRRTDGAIVLLAVEGGEAEGNRREIDLRGLLVPGAAAGMPGLSEFGVRRAALTVVDDVMEAEWSVPRLDMVFRDAPEGTVAEGAASLRLGEAEADIGFTLSPSGEAGGPSLSARLHGLSPRTVAQAHPALALLRHLTTPLSGDVSVHLDAGLDAVALGVHLQGAGGAIVDPEDSGRSVPVDGIAIVARAIDGLARLEIETVEVKALGHTARLTGGGARQDGTLSAFTHLENVPPALLFPVLPPRFAAANALDAPVSGTVTWGFDSNFRPATLDAGLTVGAGRLRVAGPESEGVAVAGGGVLLQADLAAGQVLIESLDLELDRGRVSASGSGKRLKSGWRVHLEAGAAAIPVDDFRLLWPQGMGTQGAREWILSNLSQGRVDEARIVVDADLAAGPGLDLGTPDIDGSLSFSGVKARYWRPLPSFEDIGGTAAFDTQTFALTLSGGRYRGIRVAGGNVKFTGLDRDKPPSRLAADVRFEGPLNGILEVLDREPLGYAAELQLDPAAVRGDARFRLRVGLPLLAALAFDDIEVGAEGEAARVRLPVAALKTNLEDARIEVKVDKKHVAVSGGGSLDGRPASFDFERRFPDSEPVETGYRLHTVLDEDSRARLGFELAPYVDGPVEIDIGATEFRDGRTGYKVRAGLADSAILLERLGWTKPAGEPAWLEADIGRGSDGVLEAHSIAAAGPGLEFAGRGRFDLAANRLVGGSLDRLRLGERTDLAVSVQPRPDGLISIAAKGPSIDLSRYLRREDGEEGEREGLARLAIRLETDRAWLGGDVPVQGLNAQVRMDGKRRMEVVAEAQTANGRAVSLALRPEAEKAGLRIRADDTGALLEALGWYRNMRGGRLRLNAEGPAGETESLDGSVVIKDFRIKDAPVLTRLLAAASLTGIGDALSSDAGLSFERLEAPFKLDDRRIGVGPGRAFGGSIGVTFRGDFDRDRDTVAIRGVLVPVYYVSRVLRKIPVLGDLLTGGGEGLFAASYELSGNLDDPRTRVNPLTVLAPGFLRDLFGPLLGVDGRDRNPDGRPDGKADP